MFRLLSDAEVESSILSRGKCFARGRAESVLYCTLSFSLHQLDFVMPCNCPSSASSLNIILDKCTSGTIPRPLPVRTHIALNLEAAVAGGSAANLNCARKRTLSGTVPRACERYLRAIRRG